VSFTGRDENIDDKTRRERRYTLSHLATDVQQQTGAFEPLRDWFPLSAVGAISDVTDLLQGPGQDWGTMKCGCHPNCGIGTALMISKKTKEWAPLSQFLDAERILDDARVISDSARGPLFTKLQVALSVLRNYRPFAAPKGLSLVDLIKKFDKQSGGALGGVGAPTGADRKSDEWLLLMVAGMWFQDLWTYDFRRTEMCIIPYATQMGEISFCATTPALAGGRSSRRCTTTPPSPTGTASTASTACTQIRRRRCRSASRARRRCRFRPTAH
jgi:uncharacterized radical SAM superfamily Fe-S cluster-containing enzyme